MASNIKDVKKIMRRPQLKQLSSDDEFNLYMIFINDLEITVNLKKIIENNKALSVLRDINNFRAVCIRDDDGWTAEWPELDIQIGADTLYLEGLAQNAIDENCKTFYRWRAKYNVSISDAANALGMTTRTISNYNSGRKPIPRYIALAIKGLEMENNAVSFGAGYSSAEY